MKNMFILDLKRNNKTSKIVYDFDFKLVLIHKVFH